MVSFLNNLACIWFDIVDVLDRHAGAITTVATIVIAAFTIALAISTKKLWKYGKESLAQTERAFVFLDGFNYELTTAAESNIPIEELIGMLPERYKLDRGHYITRFSVQPRWKNSGNSPTKKMTIRVNWRGPIGPIPPDYVYREDSITKFFIGQEAVEPSLFIEMPGTQAIVDWGMNPIGVEPIVFIWGRADYEDIFGKSHFTQWCYRVRLTDYKGGNLSASFIQWGEYNRTDEDQNLA